ncbi:MAG: DNA-protecting protein DprA [Verrucomicrobiaceae bacterium]|nr:DNA-protecting protein DprA [Verrucomicrobiaceae bacterium]
MTTTEAYLALNLLPGIGPVRVRKLLEAMGSPQRILSAKASQIQHIEGFGRELAELVANWESSIDLAVEVKKIEERGLTVLTQEDALYPKLLKQIHSPPLVLYVWGTLTERDSNAIGVVGSRQATHYGLTAARKMSFQLAYAGYTVVSGLARGIDTAAHEGALAAKGRTVAVIGSGIGKLYPPENAALAERISENGAVVSEFPVDYPPDRQSFPLRNRIVAGWCTGLLVAEAPMRSGSLITAQQASDMDRTIYAVPGNIDRPTSAGCNRLIQQGAKLVLSGDDILDDLMTLFPTAPMAPRLQESLPLVELGGDEKLVYEALGTEHLHVNDVIEATGLPPGAVSATLMRLEMKRVVRALPGQRYVRLV